MMRTPSSAGSAQRMRQLVLAAVLLLAGVFCGFGGEVSAQTAEEAVPAQAVPGSPASVAPPAVAAPSAEAPASTAASTPKPAAAGSPVRPRLASGPISVPNATSAVTPATETAQALRVVLGLTVLAILPALLVCLTSFLRIIIVLSMLRHAIGMNETPPNTVLIGLALFLTLFTMSPVLQKVNQDAFEPFMAGKLSMDDGYRKGVGPLREFMVRQTREADLALMVELSKAPMPRSMDDISNVQLIPSFMLSELRAAFQIGFVIFLPFLLIDLIVSSILMALGMMMMPPTTIALPLKILMFVLVDGWSLVLKALVGSFH
ncbi:flagellar type III secretion system pore protein FliP [Variovorax sp. YR566]|uniref:flagellar type III secretion system pore protein FliP n=1 Tax=Variovorax sp. YR566 TaxID=3450237 RepID=UPI003F7F3D42